MFSFDDDVEMFRDTSADYTLLSTLIYDSLTDIFCLYSAACRVMTLLNVAVVFCPLMLLFNDAELTV